MSQTKRFLYQVILWLVLWTVQWLLQGSPINFIINNVKIYIFQIILTTLLVYYTAPKFLFKKKYLIFILFSIVIITSAAFLTYGEYGQELLGIDGAPPNRPPSMKDHSHGPPKGFGFSIFPPSKTFINFMLLTITYFLSTFLEAFTYVKKKEEEAILIKSENLETELKLLKSQINPHFLFNSLNNIYALSAISTTKTQESIIYLSNMLRYVLYECDRELVPLKKEILYVKNYIKLFSLKSSKKFPINLTVSAFNDEVLLAPMLFLPYVENAFKHSNIERGGDAFISININSKDNKSINFVIKNSMPTQKIVKDDVGGIGMLNVKKRLAILYPEKHQLAVNKNEQVFSVDLTIQLD